ncbi:MAG: hypothetical protein WBH45_07255, partial [Acidobacteriaceae bacterium]
MAVRAQSRARGDRKAQGRRWLGGLLLAAMAAGGTWPGRDARAQKPSRDDVQAAYLYNFGKFVRWPEGAGHG